MLRFVLPLLALTSLLPAAFGEEAEHWTTLKVGMSPTEIVGALGQPLIQTSGRGYVLWIYDRCGEVLFFRGPVVAWTIPQPDLSPTSHPVDQDISLRPANLMPPKPVAPAQHRPVEDTGADALPSSQFRYQQRR